MFQFALQTIRILLPETVLKPLLDQITRLDQIILDYFRLF